MKNKELPANFGAWKVYSEAHERDPNGHRKYVVECPQCKLKMNRTKGDCLKTNCCISCIRSPEVLDTLKGTKLKKCVFKPSPCCSDKHCRVCAGTNRQIQVFKKGVLVK